MTIESAIDAMAVESAAKFVALCATFPTLAARNAGSVASLKAIAAAPHDECGAHVREAARFCLLVWDDSLGRYDGDLRFNLRAAWGAWDGAHRAAWQRWAAAPWFA